MPSALDTCSIEAANYNKVLLNMNYWNTITIKHKLTWNEKLRATIFGLLVRKTFNHFNHFVCVLV